MNPRISVIVPTYNRQKYIVQCIDSLLAQTFKLYEILIVDDGSTDNTKSLIRQYRDERIRHIILTHTGLPSIPRNEGIQKASGEFIALCDSDDVWMPTKLETQMELMLKNGWNASSTDASIIGNGNERYFDNYHRKYANPIHEILWNNYVITSSIVIRSDYLHRQQFNTSPEFVGYEDYYLWLSISMHTPIEFINQPLVGYRKHAESLSSKLKLQDAKKQARILFTHPAFRSHPIISSLKILKLLRQIAA
jgi:glycosyltransferase involved in cell wall biosynthesis